MIEWRWLGVSRKWVSYGACRQGSREVGWERGITRLGDWNIFNAISWFIKANMWERGITRLGDWNSLPEMQGDHVLLS